METPVMVAAAEVVSVDSVTASRPLPAGSILQLPPAGPVRASVSDLSSQRIWSRFICSSPVSIHSNVTASRLSSIAGAALLSAGATSYVR